jgi:hypothetical protein
MADAAQGRLGRAADPPDPGHRVLVRQSGPMDIAGQMTSLMTTEQRGEPPYPHRLLYDLLIQKTLPD